MFLLVFLVLSYFLVIHSIAYNCWYFKQETNVDHFFCIISFCVSGILLSELPQKIGLAPTLIIAAALSTALSWMFRAYTVRQTHRSLTFALLFSAMAILIFDWYTEHKPLSINQNSQLTWSTVILGIANIAFINFLQRYRILTVAKLGRVNKWAVEYWFTPANKRSFVPWIIEAVNWFCFYYFVVGAAGITSSVILKFTLFGILIAQITSIRGIWFMFFLCLCLSAIRVLTPYLLNNRLAPPLTEALIFFLLMFYIGIHSSRSKIFIRDAH